MTKYIRAAIASLVLLPGIASAQLSAAQITTVHNAACADATAKTYINQGAPATLRTWLNANASPAFTVWKTSVSVTAVGDKINGTELAGLTSLNNTRLQSVIMLSANGINPSLADRRQFFDDIFSGAGGVTTRAQLLALWKRQATAAEKTLSTGTGSDASPATVSWEGSVGEVEAVRMVYLDNGSIWTCP